MSTKQAQEAKLDALLRLNDIIEPGETLYTVLRHVSKSGMYRTLDVYLMRESQPMRITWTVATALGYRYDQKREALGVSGCGMDMGFDVVYNLSTALYRDEDGNYSHEGAYALNQEWM